MVGSLDLTSLKGDFVNILMTLHPLVPYQIFQEDFVFKNVRIIA